MSHPTTGRRRPNRHLVVALYLNAALLACVLVAVLSRGGGSAALAAPAMPAIGGGGGLYVVPGQLAQFSWGCFVMDIDKQTLCAYEYQQGKTQLRLVAARYFRHDRDLQNFNTGPSPEEIEKIVQLGKAGVRGQEPRPGGNDPNNPSPADPGGVKPAPGELNLPPSTGPAGVPKASEINNPG